MRYQIKMRDGVVAVWLKRRMRDVGERAEQCGEQRWKRSRPDEHVRKAKERLWSASMSLRSIGELRSAMVSQGATSVGHTAAWTSRDIFDATFTAAIVIWLQYPYSLSGSVVSLRTALLSANRYELKDADCRMLEKSVVWEGHVRKVDGLAEGTTSDGGSHVGYEGEGDDPKRCKVRRWRRRRSEMDSVGNTFKIEQPMATKPCLAQTLALNQTNSRCTLQADLRFLLSSPSLSVASALARSPIRTERIG